MGVAMLKQIGSPPALLLSVVVKLVVTVLFAVRRQDKKQVEVQIDEAETQIKQARQTA